MYLNNNSKFSDDDRYASFNISNKNTIENFTQVSNWEATSWFRNTGTDAERCNDGKNHNGYEYKYNAERHTGNNLCGNSWCCRRKNGWEATTWFKHTGNDAEKCNHGKNHNGYEYKYNVERNTK